MTTASETTAVQPDPAPAPPAAVVVAAAPAPAPESTPIPPQEPTRETIPAAEPVVDPGWIHSPGWSYDWLDYRGDRLAVRIPNKSAVHAISNLKFSTPEFQQKLFHRFLDKHLSPESYQRVCDRMVDPDDTGYADVPVDTDPLGEILRELLKAGGERIAAQAKALADAAG